MSATIVLNKLKVTDNEAARAAGTANAFAVACPECSMTRVTTIGSDVTISSGPCLLFGIRGEAASTTVVTVKDGATTKAALASGAIPLAGEVDFKGAKFVTSLVVNIAATGQNIVVFWRPL